MREISNTLWQAMLLVILVVFVFLQGWRPTLIPLLAVPVSLIGTFILFPAFGFSVNTLSLFGLVLAIGLVVDDAIVVVEAVEHHIEEGMSPRDATIRAMEEVGGPVVAIAHHPRVGVHPDRLHPGHHRPPLPAIRAHDRDIRHHLGVQRPLAQPGPLRDAAAAPGKGERGRLARFFGGFNRVFGRATEGYVGISRHMIHKSAVSFTLLGLFALGAFLLERRMPSEFLPEEDQGYVYVQMQLPNASSLQRTSAVARQVEDILGKTPGVKAYTSVIGFNLISTVFNTYSGFFFVNLKPWSERTRPEERFAAIRAHINSEVARIPEARIAAFPPPSIPGVGTSGGFTFVLEDRAGRPISFLAENVAKFMDAASKRKEITGLSTSFLASVPQIFINVDRDKVLKQGVNLTDVYQTLQCYMGGIFVNYFNRFGRQWQVYVEAEGEYRDPPRGSGTTSCATGTA